MKICFIISDAAESQATLKILRELQARTSNQDLNITLCLLSNGAKNTFLKDDNPIHNLGNITYLQVSDVHAKDEISEFGGGNREKLLTEQQINAWMDKIGNSDVVFAGALMKAHQQLCQAFQTSKQCKVIAYGDNFDSNKEYASMVEHADLLWLPTPKAIPDIERDLPKEKKHLVKTASITGHPDTDDFARTLALGEKSKATWFDQLGLADDKIMLCYLGSYDTGKNNYSQNFRAFTHLVRHLGDNYHVILSGHPSALREDTEKSIIEQEQLDDKFTIIDMDTKRSGLSSNVACGLADIIVSPGGSTMEIQLSVVQPNLPLWIVKHSESSPDTITWYLYNDLPSEITAKPDEVVNTLKSLSASSNQNKENLPRLLPHSADQMARWLLAYAEQHQKTSKKRASPMDLMSSEHVRNISCSSSYKKSEADYDLSEHLDRHPLWRGSETKNRITNDDLKEDKKSSSEQYNNKRK